MYMIMSGMCYWCLCAAQALVTELERALQAT